MGLGRFLSRFFTDHSQISLGQMIDEEFLAAGKAKAAERKLRDEAEKERRRLEQEAERSRREYERNRPLEEVRMRVEAGAQRRRDDARAQCEMLYSLYAPEIGKRFPRQEFKEFASKYLSDNHPPEYVEERAQQLQALILQHRDRAEPAPAFRNLEDIARWFDHQKRQVEAVPDEKLRRTLLVKLKERYTELSSKLLEDMHP